MALPELYQEKEFQRQTFDRNSEFMKRNPNFTARGTRKFNRYWNSDQRLEDEKAFKAAQDAAELAHIQEEARKRAESWDARIAALRKQNATRGATTLTNINASLASKPVIPTLVLKDAARWNQVASQYGFKDYNDVAAWQKENGLEADGKFGAASYAKWAQLNPDKVETVPVIKPKTVTPVTPVKPAAPVTPPPVTQSTADVTSSNPAETTPAETTPAVAHPTAEEMWDNKYFRPNHNGNWRYITIDGKKYPILVTTGLYNNKIGLENDHSYAYDPETGKIMKLKEDWRGWASETDGDWQDIPHFYKRGGTMNRINYFQQGGTAPQQQDMQAQVVALVQAAMQGDQKATETVNKIMEAAKAGDKQAMQIAQMIQQVAQKMQGQATSAKWGSKLNYIRSLKFAKGGKACPECEKGAPIVEKKACGGKKAKKRYFGGLV